MEFLIVFSIGVGVGAFATQIARFGKILRRDMTHRLGKWEREQAERIAKCQAGQHKGDGCCMDGDAPRVFARDEIGEQPIADLHAAEVDAAVKENVATQTANKERRGRS